MLTPDDDTTLGGEGPPGMPSRTMADSSMFRALTTWPFVSRMSLARPRTPVPRLESYGSTFFVSSSIALCAKSCVRVLEPKFCFVIPFWLTTPALATKSRSPASYSSLTYWSSSWIANWEQGCPGEAAMVTRNSFPYTGSFRLKATVLRCSTYWSETFTPLAFVPVQTSGTRMLYESAPPARLRYRIALYGFPLAGGLLDSTRGRPVVRGVFEVWNSGDVTISCCTLIMASYAVLPRERVKAYASRRSCRLAPPIRPPVRIVERSSTICSAVVRPYVAGLYLFIPWLVDSPILVIVWAHPNLLTWLRPNPPYWSVSPYFRKEVMAFTMLTDVGPFRTVPTLANADNNMVVRDCV